MVLKLRSYEGEIFEVPEKVARHSQVLFRLIEDMDPKAPIHVVPGTVPVPIVTSKVLAKVLDYCKKHAEAADEATTEMATDGSSIAPASARLSDQELNDWDNKFANSVDLLMLGDLIIAADYLEIDGLLHLICQKKNSMHFCKIRNTQNEFSAEEEFELLRQNQWAMN